MKENPALHKVIENMKPGVISLHGFMGKDSRSLDAIIEHDAAELDRLGVNAIVIAIKLEEIRDTALKGLGNFVNLGDGFLVKADSIRGKLPCPFDHPGLFRKTVITIQDREDGSEFCYTDLGIHMIREHGFFQGKGSPFRIEPVKIAKILKKI